MYSRNLLLSSLHPRLRFAKFATIYGRVFECGDFCIEIDNTLSLNETIGTLAHEITHIVEYMEGRCYYAHTFAFKRTEQYILSHFTELDKHQSVAKNIRQKYRNRVKMGKYENAFNRTTKKS